ncbi:hypothetical protein Asp14428_22610 [Actinoplanes sp. NBRC 14428]|uniref:Uncharacterized protein n=1 Tax=Pseudosporangium ferrugineum TaxID=439699 RepID=A0A2T0RLA7_9ACTN|nr:hypothetical protein [Pseudosporangium ferrugineum]PRY21948.1 hypothetical protein CLV70_11813 [Pseudosporangium ferrugineum]BCJ50786.1 hypothetical protein Asp14428_22610 [Actinoplanes sp. NBRC 14428]
MPGGRLRVSRLRLQIRLAHLVATLRAMGLVLLIAGVLVVMAVPRIWTGQRHVPRPDPLPSLSASPTLRVTPQRSSRPPAPTTRATTRPAGPGQGAEAPAPTPSRTPPTTRTSPARPVVESPRPDPVRLTLGLEASPDYGDVRCGQGRVVRFTGTVEVDRTTTVTTSWDPAEVSSDPISKEVTPARKRTVTRQIPLTGKPGDHVHGTMTLIASAPGAGQRSRTVDYSLTCT